jgi:hypothetical protein
MHPDRDFDPGQPSANDAIHFAQDVELSVLLGAAAAGDRYLYDFMAAACASAWANDFSTISYRQNVLKDCLANPDVVRQFYAIAIEPFSREKSWSFGLFGRDPSSMVSSSVRTLQACLEVLRRLRDVCNRNSGKFASLGFRRFFGTLNRNLDDAYLEAVGADLNNLTFRSGLLLSAGLGDGGGGVGTMPRKTASARFELGAKMADTRPAQLHPAIAPTR